MLNSFGRQQGGFHIKREEKDEYKGTAGSF